MLKEKLISAPNGILVLLFVIAMLIIPVAMIIMAAKAAEGGAARPMCQLVLGVELHGSAKEIHRFGQLASINQNPPLVDQLL